MKTVKDREIIEEILSSESNKLDYLIECIVDDDYLFTSDDDDEDTLRNAILDLLYEYLDNAIKEENV